MPTDRNEAPLVDDAPPGFETHALDDEHVLFVGRVPNELRLDDAGLERLWDLHPSEYHEIHLHGRTVKTPRWQQAYAVDYRYSGRVNEGLEVPGFVEPYRAWARRAIDPRLNGLLLIWYDAALGHYIGKHRDSTTNMLDGAPIVTISFGASRLFRLRPYRGRGFLDFPADDGRVFVMPYATNLAWTHEVLKRASDRGRRISLTLRAFETDG